MVIFWSLQELRFVEVMSTQVLEHHCWWWHCQKVLPRCRWSPLTLGWGWLRWSPWSQQWVEAKLEQPGHEQLHWLMVGSPNHWWSEQPNNEGNYISMYAVKDFMRGSNLVWSRARLNVCLKNMSANNLFDSTSSLSTSTVAPFGQILTNLLLKKE